MLCRCGFSLKNIFKQKHTSIEFNSEGARSRVINIIIFTCHVMDFVISIIMTKNGGKE